MNNMIIRVLIINRQLVFAVTIKQALEQTGAFEVHPFTDPNAAIEYLRSHPHDVALVDFEIQVQPGPEIVAQLRAVQPDIALIVSPTQSGTVLQQLDVQDTVDAPFSARGIIPVIERAVEQVSKPSSAITRNLVQPDEGGNLTTDVLPDERHDPPTEILSSVPSTPAGTRILDDEEPDEGSVSPAQTRILNDEVPDEAPSGGVVEPAQTRILDNEAPDEVLSGDSVAPAQTRILDDEAPDEAPSSGVGEPTQTRILDDSFSSDPDHFPPTGFDDAEVDAPLPPTLPEFSSLGSVLSDEAPSALFEPPVRDDDTPAVPEAESGAVRQYLATTSDPKDSLFDDMLSAIPASDEPSPDPSSDNSNFDNLVNSMRAEGQHTPLPDRHQQFVEFILTGGMDHLLTEIGKSHDEPPDLPEQLPDKSDRRDHSPTDVFQRLIEDEPPMPSLEDSGTIGDLMVGVSDSSFRNVLAMMRGQEVIDEESDEQSAQLRKEIEAAYTAFFEQESIDDESDDFYEKESPPSLPQAPSERESESAIPARLILETALDESTPIESFSLNNLIGDIERQLTAHKPDVTPLPSWDIESFRPKRRRPSREEADELERYIKEPDFLPEELTELSAASESVAEKFSQAENLTEDELTDLSRDLFDEMVSTEARQTAMLESHRDVEEEVAETGAAIPDEALLDYEQETVPSAPVDDVDERVFDSPRLPEDEALLDADEALPDVAWDSVPDDWDSYTAREESEAETETEDTVEGYALLEDEQATFAQETVIHHWDDEPESESSGVIDEAPPDVVSESLWDEPLAGQADWDDSEPAPPEMPVVDSEDEEDWTSELSIDEAPAAPEELLPEDLWDDMAGVSVLADSDEADSEAFEDADLLTAFEDDWSLTIDETPDEQTVMIDQPETEQRFDEPEPIVDERSEAETFDIVEADNPYVAQIALSLTQMSLELAAEATLITNAEEIVALAGHLNQADIEEIRDAIADDWDANADQARVRFITLPSSNKDYMLYSRKTVGDFTLSMIFAGTTPLRDIRRQGKRLQDALETVPEVIEEVDQEPDLPGYALATDGDEPELTAIDEPVMDVGALQPYTYLWLLRDPADAFDERRSRMVMTGLGIQLREMGWQIETLQVQDEYVYIRADVPGEAPAYEIIDDLKRRVAEIIRVQEPDLPADQDLWADSYLVMMPGRELDPEEISQFISFERML